MLLGKKVFVVILLLILSICSLSAQPEKAVRLGFQLKDGQTKAVIPFEIHNNLIVIPVILNDALPLKFILDTGVRTAILTDRTISDLINLAYSRTLSIYGIGGEKIVDAQIANNVTLELPGIRGKGHALFILEEDLLQLRNFLGTEIHGILGYELLSRFIVKINFSRQRITVYDPEVFKAPKRYRQLKMDIQDTKPYISVPLTIDGKDSINARLMIDTGASHTLMLLNNEYLSFKIPENNVESNLGRGLGGPILGRVARIKGMSIDGYELKDPIVTFPYKENYPDSMTFKYRNGSIGGALLSRFNVIFDYHSGILYLKKNSRFKKPINYNLSGLVVKADGIRLKEFIIEEVREDSPGYAAGLKRGDIILAVNDRPTKDMVLDNIVGYFNSKVNRHIRLTVLREGKRITASFKLKRTL